MQRQQQDNNSSSEDDSDDSSGSSDDEDQVNPVTGKPMWKWGDGDVGYRRPGSKGNSRLFHRCVQRGDGA